jgi:hypothetical protein
VIVADIAVATIRLSTSRVTRIGPGSGRWSVAVPIRTGGNWVGTKGVRMPGTTEKEWTVLGSDAEAAEPSIGAERAR